MEKFKEQYLTQDQVLKISQAVAEAEKSTSGEIVPMIVFRSSTIGHLPFYCGFIVLTFFLLLLHSWQPWWLYEWYGSPVVGIFILSFVLGYFLAFIPWVQRFLTPGIDQESQVWQRAQSEWALSKLHKTKARTGILIFVSIMERKAIVMGDEGIARHYSQDTWNEVVDLLSGHLHRNEWVQGFEKAIAKCGEILQKHLPPSAENPNEIPDQLIIKP